MVEVQNQTGIATLIKNLKTKNILLYKESMVSSKSPSTQTKSQTTQMNKKINKTIKDKRA